MSTTDNRRLEGYDKLATLFASDSGLACFRRFDKLNAKNLLYYQAELAIIEEDLETIIQSDKCHSYEEKKFYPCCVRDLKDSLRGEKGVDSLQWRKFLEARELLKEYNNALIQHRELIHFSAPDETDYKVFEQWMMTQELCQGVRFASKAEMNVYHKGNKNDLIALCNRQEGVDNLTRWIFDRPIAWFQGRLGAHFEGVEDTELGTVRYNDRRIRAVTYVVSIFAAVILPVSCLLVKARRVEIFAAVTA
ncbi:hypothetical protein EYZ11_011685 [Aspergillus tanneri]|nr:hypothetical protein EYZ11_011685 [Aspergillus tanneri]